MSCSECGQPQVWGGMSWVPHVRRTHERRHAALYEAIAGLLEREARTRVRAAQAGAQGLVGVSMRSGVYRGLSTWHTVTREFWDELGEPGAFMNMDRDWLLAHLRESASEYAWRVWGVEVNPATWFHTIYDNR